MKKLRRKTKFGIILFTVFLGSQIILAADTFAANTATISVSLSASPKLNLMSGKFGSASQSITVTTDNYTGSTTTLIGQDDSADLVNVADSTLSIPTITLPDGKKSITADEFASGYGVSADGTNYFPAPTSASSFAVGGNTAAGTVTQTLTFGAKPAIDAAVGKYTRTFIVMVVANAPQYSVAYNANAGSDAVTDMPSNESTVVSDTGTFTLPNNTPSRTGYAFLGWDKNSTVTTPTYPADTTNTITLDPTTDNNIALYAIWHLTHNVTYQNLDDSNFPSSVLSGEPLSITITDSNVIGFTIRMGENTLVKNTDYTYQNNILTIPNVSDDLDISAIIDEPVIADYTEEFTETTGPTATVTTQLNNMSPTDFFTKIFAYSNNTGRTISSISVQIVYSKSNQGATTGSLIGKLNYNGSIYTASPVSIARGKVTNQTVEIAQFNNLNIPSASDISFTIGTDSDAFSATITISSQTVTVTFAD